jgi:sulfite oxidase
MKISRRHFFETMAAAGVASQAISPGADTPKRDMIVRSARPQDLELPLSGFDQWITPTDRFFVRSHHYTPDVNLSDWHLSISGEVEHPVTLTMDEIKKLPRVEMVAVLECAGNGRALYEPPVPGAQWVYGGVSNGRWAGVRFADVLAKAGLKSGAQYILSDGADVAIGTMPEFMRAVPVKKALDRDTILAYELNGQPLPASHGFPLRLVAPGWAGDSWAKWLTSVKVLDKEFDGFWMKTGYRHPGKAVPPGTAIDPAKMKPVESLRIKSIIAGPAEDSQLPVAPIRIHGTAWSGESPVASVEVSVDRGRTWQKAKLGRDQSKYAWRLWETSWTPPQTGYYVIMARAFDAAGQTQPMVQEWNPSGYLNNVVHKVAVEISESPQSAEPSNAKTAENVPKTFEQPKGFRAACLPCHGEDIVMQQRLTRVQWERELDKMIRWGAKVDASDREGMIDYLLRLYGPRPRK